MNEKQRTTSTESHTLTAAKVLLFEAGNKIRGRGSGTVSLWRRRQEKLRRNVRIWMWNRR